MRASGEFTAASGRVALVSFMSTLLHASIIAAVATGVYLPAISHDLGWTRAQVGAGVTLNYWGTALGAAVAGRFVDRFGPRSLIVPSALLSGLLLAAFGLINGSRLWFYALFFLLGVSVPGAVGYSKLLSGWFFRRRGLALSGLGVGIFLATIIVPPTAARLQSLFGWRGGFVALGAAIVVILFPAVALFARERQSAHSSRAVVVQDPDGAPGMSTREVWASRAFWLLAAAQLGSKFAYGAFMVHAVGILTEQGLSPSQAVIGMSAVGIGGLIAQVATGWLVDRFNSPRVMIPIAATSVAGLILIHSAPGQYAVLAGAVLLGVGAGGEDSVMSYLITRFFGVRNFARVYGSMMPLVMVAAAPAPILVGAMFDRSRSYHLALWALEAGMGLGVVAFCLLKPFPFPTEAARRQREAASSVALDAGEVAEALAAPQ